MIARGAKLVKIKSLKKTHQKSYKYNKLNFFENISSISCQINKM